MQTNPTPMLPFRKTLARPFLFAALLLYGLGGVADAQLYTLDVLGRLLTVDPDSGDATEVFPLPEGSSWSGLSGAGDLLYALHNPRPALFEDPQFSRLARLNPATNDATLLPLFDSEELGVVDVFATGLAISPLTPDAAVVVGSDAKQIPPTPWIWEVDLSTGAITSPARELSNVVRLEAIAYAPDGESLFGTNQRGELVTIDVAAGDVTAVGDPDLSNFLTGLAFAPTDGTLFAINGHSQDELVTLDPTSGAVVEKFGALGFAGPEGLAFLAPSVDLDCNQDGSVDLVDLDCANAADVTTPLLSALGLVAGDLDGENGVDFADFIIFAESFGRPRGKYTEGDLDDNGQVDFADFVIFSGNFGRQAAAVAVPEPATGGLLLGAALLLYGRRRRIA